MFYNGKLKIQFPVKIFVLKIFTILYNCNFIDFEEYFILILSTKFWKVSDKKL